MPVFSTIAKSIFHFCLNTSKPYSSQLLSNLNSVPDISASHRCQFQSIRTLILQSASESVKLNRLFDSDSGIVEVNLDRPEAKNAIGRDMLRGLQNSFQEISKDSSANVLMISSSVPKVFCAGADLKERKTMNPSEVEAFVNSLRSTFTFLEFKDEGSKANLEGIEYHRRLRRRTPPPPPSSNTTAPNPVAIKLEGMRRFRRSVCISSSSPKQRRGSNRRSQLLCEVNIVGTQTAKSSKSEMKRNLHR